MKVFLQLIGALLVCFVAILVNAWGYQILWNDVVLNVWEIFSAGTVPTALTYGVCVAIAVAVGLLRTGNNKNEGKEYGTYMTEACSRIVVKLISIGLTLLAVTIIF
jgi:hypothetical protein